MLVALPSFLSYTMHAVHLKIPISRTCSISQYPFASFISIKATFSHSVLQCYMLYSCTCTCSWKLKLVDLQFGSLPLYTTAQLKSASLHTCMYDDPLPNHQIMLFNMGHWKAEAGMSLDTRLFIDTFASLYNYTTIYVHKNIIITTRYKL